MRRITPTEFQIQCAVIEWAANRRYGNYYVRDFLFAIPNGGSRHKIEANNLKRAGVLSGVPDLFLTVPSRGYHGWFGELKTIEGRVTKAQKSMIYKLNENGYFAGVYRTVDDTIDSIINYLF